MSDKTSLIELSLGADEASAVRFRVRGDFIAVLERMPGISRGSIPAATRRAPNRARVIPQIRQLRHTVGSDMIGVLTPEQKEAWDTMVGAEFEWPKE